MSTRQQLTKTRQLLRALQQTLQQRQAQQKQQKQQMPWKQEHLKLQSMRLHMT